MTILHTYFLTHLTYSSYLQFSKKGVGNQKSAVKVVKVKMVKIIFERNLPEVIYAPYFLSAVKKYSCWFVTTNRRDVILLNYEL